MPVRIKAAINLMVQKKGSFVEEKDLPNAFLLDTTTVHEILTKLEAKKVLFKVLLS